MRARVVARWLGIAVMLAAGSARSQSIRVPAFELERLELDPSAVGSLVVNSGALPPEHGLRFGVALHYENEPLLVYQDGARVGALIAHRGTVHAFGAFVVHPRLELFAQVPVVAFQSGDDLSARGLIAPSAAGLGTPFLGGRFALLRSERGPLPDVAFALAVGLPIGSGEALANNAGFSLSPQLSAGKTFGWLRPALSVGALIRPTTAIGPERVGSQLTVAGALATVNEGLRGELSLRSGISFTGLPTAAELLVGARYAFKSGVELFALGGPGFSIAPGDPRFRILAGLAYASAPAAKAPVVVYRERPVDDPCAPGKVHAKGQCPELDDDGDGIKNGADQCVDVPEDKDGFEDHDGCPELDNDNDGLADKADECPNEAGPAEREGCPIPDADKDGVPDGDDLCPSEQGPPERHGCPFKDEDQDGIEDAVDACPKEPGPLEARGCPIKDEDGDGVPDHVDNCPKEKGPADNQGCPKKQKQLVVITRERLEIKDKVYFATGKATLLPRSFKLLNQVASVLMLHPEIPRVQIEGHTDNRGSAELNRTLSQARAEAVRDYLAKQGVDAQRLGAKGFGPDRPAAPNATAKGRELNRRVEFTIRMGADEPESPKPPDAGAKP